MNEKLLYTASPIYLCISYQEARPVKKTHPLAMHWEKLQEEKKRETSKYDNEVKKRLQESERRKKGEGEVDYKPEKARISEQQEKDDLQNRRRSLAETWEAKGRIKSNNNNTKASQQLSKNISKNEFGKSKSPKKSPAAKTVGFCFALYVF